MEKQGREMQKGKQKTPSCSGALKLEAAMPPTCSQVVTSRDRSDDGKGGACYRGGGGACTEHRSNIYCHPRSLPRALGVMEDADDRRWQRHDKESPRHWPGLGKLPALGIRTTSWRKGHPPGTWDGKIARSGACEGTETRAHVLGAREGGQKINLKEFFWLEGGI